MANRSRMSAWNISIRVGEFSIYARNVTSPETSMRGFSKLSGAIVPGKGGRNDDHNGINCVAASVDVCDVWR